MCDCYRIGGPWIAEDPNCPTHGTEARIKRDEAESLRTKIENLHFKYQLGYKKETLI